MVAREVGGESGGGSERDGDKDKLSGSRSHVLSLACLGLPLTSKAMTAGTPGLSKMTLPDIRGHRPPPLSPKSGCPALRKVLFTVWT